MNHDKLYEDECYMHTTQDIISLLRVANKIKFPTPQFMKCTLNDKDSGVIHFK